MGSKSSASLLGNADDFTTQVQSRAVFALVDESVREGGMDAGFRPFELVVGGLAACTAITIRMYLKRKGWPVGDIEVHCELSRDGDSFIVERRVKISHPLSSEQLQRVAAICERTPVTLLVKGGAAVKTSLEA